MATPCHTFDSVEEILATHYMKLSGATVVHSQLMTKVDLGQVFSCWSNVSRLRFDHHVSQLTNFGQLVILTLTKICLTYDQDIQILH